MTETMELEAELDDTRFDRDEAQREHVLALEKIAELEQLLFDVPGAELDTRVAQLTNRIKELETGYEQSLADLNVQCKFWRQAAEHAVNGWNALEDRVEAARDILDALEGNADAVRELLGLDEEWAPPLLEQRECIPDAPPDPSDAINGWPLRIVEDETPIKEKP